MCFGMRKANRCITPRLAASVSNTPGAALACVAQRCDEQGGAVYHNSRAARADGGLPREPQLQGDEEGGLVLVWSQCTTCPCRNDRQKNGPHGRMEHHHINTVRRTSPICSQTCRNNPTPRTCW